jgi:hypothetical protein
VSLIDRDVRTSGGTNVERAVAVSSAERSTPDPVKAVSVVSTGTADAGPGHPAPAHDPTAAQRLLKS